MHVCLLGAECTGKTTLATALAQELDAVLVPEYLRVFVQQHGRVPAAQDQATILRTQMAWEADAVHRITPEGKTGIVCDTAPLMTAVYSAHYFGDTALLPEALAHHARYTHTLLLEPDFPWQADGSQRDGPATRDAVHHRLCTLLAEAAITHTRITGTLAQRLHHALVCLRT